MNLRDLFLVGTNLKNNLFKNNKQISFTITTRTWVFFKRMGQNVAKYWYPNEKMAIVPVCFNVRCSYSGCVDIVYHITKGKGGESLLLLAFRKYAVNIIFLKYSKEGRFSSSQ